MSEQKHIPGSGNGEKSASEDQPLEALLAEMPRRRCPPRVRENVIAALRQERVAPGSGDRSAKARVVSFGFRRNSRWLVRAAALLVFGVVGVKVLFSLKKAGWFDFRDSSRHVPALRSEKSLKAPAPSTDAEISTKAAKKSSSIRSLAMKATACAEPRPPERPHGKAARSSYGQEAASTSRRPESRRSSARSTGTRARSSLTGQALNEPVQPPGTPEFARAMPATPDSLGIESSAPLGEDLLEQNTIEGIRLAAIQVRKGKPEKATTWTVFTQNAIGSFNRLANNFGGAVTSSTEVLLSPGDRRAILVDCLVPESNARPLLDAVNNRRIVASIRRGQAEGAIVAGADFSLARKPSEIESRLSDTAGQVDLTSGPIRVTARYLVQVAPLGRPLPLQQRKALLQETIEQNGRESHFSGGFAFHRGATLSATPSQTADSGRTSGTLQPTQSGLAFGLVDQQAAVRNKRLFFILEPDRLPVPAIPASARKPKAEPSGPQPQ